MLTPLGGTDAELREEPRRIVPRLPFHTYGDVDRFHAVSLPYEFVAWNCTCGRRDFLGIRHDMTEIRHVATGIRLDPLPYTKMAPMVQCVMGAI